jgi:uncharacterized membrane protein
MPLHPLIVHFPIALLFVAGGFYIYALIKSSESIFSTGSLLHLIGSLSFIVAILTGQQAESAVTHTREIHEIITQHELLSYISIWIFALMYIWQMLRNKKFLQVEKLGFVGLFIIVLCIMGYSAHLGAKMVYEKGAGVIPMQNELKKELQKENE